MPLILHRSHRLENLAEALADQLRQHPRPPLEQECVVVPSLGVRRWLSHELARRLGVAMNIRFPFPAQFFEESLFSLTGNHPSPLFRREVLRWKIHALLPPLLPEPDFTSLQRYAKGDPLQIWHLAGQIAEVFDRYLAYRPELLLKWNAGEQKADEAWQAQLWRMASQGESYAAQILERHVAEQRKQRPRFAQEDLPLFAPQPPRVTMPAPEPERERIAFFGLTTLPPFHLRILENLSAQMEIHLYLQTPTREYWGDVRSIQEQARIRRWMIRRGLNPDDAGEFAAPHPLLASLGKIGREFHEALLDLTPAEEPLYFDAAPPKSLLQHVQATFLDLTLPEEPISITAEDRSLQVHSCHSPLRELEVLHDQLLALFEKDPTLEPRDVLVAVTDMDSYAPCIEAVFGAPENDQVRFPFSVADRAARAENPVAGALLRFLRLLDSRFAASEVLALLDCEPIRNRFQLTENDLPLVREWVIRSGIRWGIDENHRAGLHLPGRRDHTWRHGLDRLLLGFALPPDGWQLCADILPDGDLEGDLAETLGNFAAFCSTLFAAAERLVPKQATAQEWSTELRTTLAAICAGDDDFAEPYRVVSAQFESLENHAQQAGHRDPIPFGVIRHYLVSAFADDNSGSGFLRGGITFCSLKPMRAIPHRVVAVLGMNGDAFPRAGRTLAFDLAATAPRAGDRSLRDDDRYLFLEMIQSARDVLLLSYGGQSIRDNSAAPPSVLVAELLDHVDRHYRPAEGTGKMSGRLTRHHRLQAFSPRYFSGEPPWFSYSEENARAASHAQGTRQPTGVFGQKLNPVPVERTISLEALTQALSHPSRFFAQNRLGLALPGEEEPVEDCEPIVLDGLARYQLATTLTETHLRGAMAETLLPFSRAGGLLPHGYAGESAFADSDLLAQKIVEEIELLAPGDRLPSLTFQQAVGDWTLFGALDPWTATALLRFRPGRLRARDQLAAWLAHLLICAAIPAGYPLHTVAIGTTESLSFPPLPALQAEQELTRLLGLYERAHAEALPFFPETSLVYADYALNLNQRKSSDPMNAALKQWNGDSFGKSAPESADAWHALLWGDHPAPLGEEFQRIALAIFEPMLRVLHAGIVGGKGDAE